MAPVRSHVLIAMSIIKHQWITGTKEGADMLMRAAPVIPVIQMGESKL